MAQFFKINNKTIKSPSEISLSYEDLDKAERTIDGTMVVDLIGIKRKVDVSWEYLSKEDMAVLAGEVKSRNFTLIPKRHHLDTRAGEQSERLLDIEQRRVLYRHAACQTLYLRHQRQHIGRALLQPENPLPLGCAAVGVGIDPVETLRCRGEILLCRGIHHLHIFDAHTAHIFACDSRQHLVTLQRHHAPETACHSRRIHSQTAGQIEQTIALDTLRGGALLAR